MCLGLGAVDLVHGGEDEDGELPPGFELVALPGEIELPVGLAFAPDGTLFVLGQAGLVLVYIEEQPQPAPFLDLRDEVNHNLDRGLLGIAIHPDWRADGGETSWVYLLYTVSPVSGEDWGYNQDDRYSFSRLTRYRSVSLQGAIVAEPASRQILLGRQQPDGTVPDGIASLHISHSNGSMHFGTDGSLLVAAGDGAHFDSLDPGGLDAAGFEDFVHPVTGLRGPMPREQDSGAFRAQDLRSLSGKILRIRPDTGEGYASNPFYDGDPSSNASKVWALGLRNPFRTCLLRDAGALDPNEGRPGALLLGDVGWLTWEEIHLVRGGENFGWPCFEGPLPQPGYQEYLRDKDPLSRPDCTTKPPGVPAEPLVAYHHSDPALLSPSGIHLDADGEPGPGFAGGTVIGGELYLGGSYPIEYQDRYFFADFILGWIRTLQLDAEGQPVAVRDFAQLDSGPVALARHPLRGELYLASILDGRILRLRYNPNQTPAAIVEAEPTSGEAPLEVEFDGSDSHDPDGDPLSYDWDFGDASAHAGEPEPRHVYTEPGEYSVRLTVTDPEGLAASAGTSITVFTPASTPTASPSPTASPTPIAVGAGTDSAWPLVLLAALLATSAASAAAGPGRTAPRSGPNQLPNRVDR
jgi:glucose/arabinose dehydrogenase